MSKITELDPKSPVAEAYRTVRTNLSFSDIDNELKTILFTSTKQNEGKSTVIANIAYSFSQLENKKILLMDLDLRNPTVHRMFQVGNTYGLMDNLMNNRNLDKCISVINNNLHILSTGSIPPNPTEILSSKKMRELMGNIRNEYDYVFIDAPPVGVVSDASIIASYIDGVMFVVGANETDLSHAEMAVESLKKTEANIIGAVLNKYDAGRSNFGYYGYYYQQDETSNTRKSRRAKDKKSGFLNKKMGFSR